MGKYDFSHLKTENLECYIDEVTDILYVVYRGEIDSNVTSQAYSWQAKFATPEVLKSLKGSIFDFREVTKFNPGNLSTIQRKSRELNTTVQEYLIPVALLVNNLYQEQMVRVSAQISPSGDRKRIVKSVEEGLAFCEDYNRQTKSTNKPN
jgi:hypothetical protein